MKRIENCYVITGIVAILIGGMISAFYAKSPSTYAMWLSAYMVLVVGMCQVFFGFMLERLVDSKISTKLYTAFGLLNAGNILVMVGTAAKYASVSWSMTVTMSGSIMLIVALLLLAWLIRGTTYMKLRTISYVLIMVLVVCVPLGLLLAKY